MYTGASSVIQNASTTATITIPGTASVGDICLIATTSQSSVSAAPTGFTLYTGFPTTNTSSAGRSNLYYKILASGDPGSTRSLTFSASTRIAIGAWTGNNAGIDAVSIASTATSTSVQTSAISATNPNSTLVCFFNGITSSTSTVGTTMTVPGTMAERIDASTAGSGVRQSSVCIADEEYAASGAVGTRTATASQTLQTIPFSVVLTPAPAGGTFNTNGKFFAFF